MDLNHRRTKTNCGCGLPTDTNRQSTNTVLEGANSIETIHCGKPILSITKVNGKVVVMYNDCSFSTADLSVVDKEVFNDDKIECLTERAKALTEVVNALANRPDKTYDDSDVLARLNALEARSEVQPYDDSDLKQRLSMLESKPDNDTIYNDEAIQERLSKLEDKQFVTQEDLVIVTNLEGKDLFKAIKLNDGVEQRNSVTDFGGTRG